MRENLNVDQIPKHLIRTFALSLALLLCSLAATAAEARGLAIETSPTGKAYLSYHGAPLFAFGPGDEMRIVSGAADIDRWVQWQREHGMNLIRAYPTSVPLEARGAPGLDPFVRKNGKWDVDTFNDAYFEYMAKAAETLEKNDIILHLQLWQIVFFKDGEERWDINYINPKNNVNEWTKVISRGNHYIDAPADSPARAHQRRWVLRILDAMKGRQNVIIDVINELGNAMGSMGWAVEVTRWIRTWEQENDWSFIVGVDSEHHYSPERFAPFKDHFDLIILNELRSRGHALQAIEAFNMPAVSVRSSDGLNQPSDYIFLDPDRVGPEHQTRYRTLCYRSLFAGLQSIGAYWKPLVSAADYRDMEHWPVYARALRQCWEIISPHWPLLKPVTDDTFLAGAVTPQAYALESPGLIAVYLECGSHTWNNAYPASTLKVHCAFDQYEARYFNPSTGEISPIEAVRDGGMLTLPLPKFTDDAVVLIEAKGNRAQ